MVLPITQYGDGVLREKCAPVGEVTEEIKTLAENMIETMIDAEGVGLAAPQVGKAIQLAVVDVSHDPDCISYLRVNGKEVDLAQVSPLVFINPEFTLKGVKESELEGCLSIQELRAKVKRPTEIEAKLPQLDGSVLTIETDGLFARALQHEIDHLNGVLFTDRVSSAARLKVSRSLAKLLR